MAEVDADGTYFVVSDGLGTSAYRFYNDDVSLNSATARAALNTAANIQLGVPFKLRIQLESPLVAHTSNYMLEFNRNNGTWQPILNVTDIRAQASDFFSDGEVTTQRLSSISPYQMGEGVETVRMTTSITVPFEGVTEIEWCLVAAEAVVGDVFRFRVVIPVTGWYGSLTYSAYTMASGLVPTANVISGGVSPPPPGANAMRATVYEGSLIGVESTPGTPVTATKRLLCTNIDENPTAPIRPYRVGGSKFVTGTAHSKEYTDLPINGQMCYTDSAYLFSSLLQKVTSPPAPAKYYTLVMNGASGGTFTLTYNAVATGAITVSTLTADAIATALEAINTIGAGNVFVTGSGTAADPYLIQLTGTKATDSNSMTASLGAVTGGVPTFTASTTASVAKRWVFRPNVFAPDTIQTFTLERGILGTASLAMQIPYMVVAGLDFRINKDEASFSGAGFGSITAEPFTMNTSNIVDVASIEVDPSKVGVWLGDSVAGLTRLKRCLELELGISGKQGPLMTLREDHSSFSDTVESNNEYGGKLTLVHDIDSINLLAKLRGKTQQVLRLEARGPNIESGYPYRLVMQTPIELINNDRGSTDDAKTGIYDFNMAYNSTSGVAMHVELDVNFSTL